MAASKITWTFGDFGAGDASTAIEAAGNAAKRSLDRSAGRLAGFRAPRAAFLGPVVSTLVTTIGRTHSLLLAASERLGGGYGRLNESALMLPGGLLAGVASSRVLTGLFEATVVATSDLAVRLLDLQPVAEQVFLRLKPRMLFLGDWISATFWGAIDRMAALWSILWARSALAVARLAQGILEVGLKTVDLVRVALPASIERSIMRALGGSLGRMAGVVSSLEATSRDARVRLRGIDAKVMEPLEAYILRATMPGGGGSAAGTIARDQETGPSWLERVGAVIADWGRRPEVRAVGDAIGAMLARGEERLSVLLGGVTAAIQHAARHLAGLGESLTPVATATAGLTEALSLVGAQAERIAQTSSSAARIVQRSRTAVLAALALVRSAIETAQGVAALLSFQVPRAVLHFASAGLFAAAAGVAIAGGIAGGRRIDAIAPRGALPRRALTALSQPRAVGSLTLIVRSTTALPDDEWVRRNILEPIASGGAVHPPGATVREIDMDRIRTPDELREILRQIGEHVLFTPGVGVLEFLGFGWLINVQDDLKRFGKRVEKETRRITRRIKKIF